LGETINTTQKTEILIKRPSKEVGIKINAEKNIYEHVSSVECTEKSQYYHG
jgi:DNA helicase TIP49 (TBP-interacting protein)